MNNPSDSLCLYDFQPGKQQNNISITNRVSHSKRDVSENGRHVKMVNCAAGISTEVDMLTSY